jgi:cell division protein FtsB
VRAPRAATAPPIPQRLPQAPPAIERAARRSIEAARRLRDSHMVDRLVRGRSWIGLLGVLLIGLVALNVSLLKLNAAAGRNAEWAKKLRVENADLRARVSRLGSGQNIQTLARAQGLVMPAAGSVHYLTVDASTDARRAARRGSFVPLSSTSDLVSAAPVVSPVVPAAPVQAPAPAAGPTGVEGPTGTAGAPATTAPATTTTPAATGTTGATGATTP